MDQVYCDMTSRDITACRYKSGIYVILAQKKAAAEPELQIVAIAVHAKE